MTTETKVQHTPGPWKVTDAPAFMGNSNCAAVIAPLSSDAGRGRTVALINGLDWYANAHLIAAAPALLEALEATTRQYAAFVQQCCKDEDNRYHERQLTKARQAIALAKGVQDAS